MQPIAKVDLSALRVVVKKQNPYHASNGLFASASSASSKSGFTSKLDGKTDDEQKALIQGELEEFLQSPGVKTGVNGDAEDWHAATKGKISPKEFVGMYLGPEGLAGQKGFVAGQPPGHQRPVVKLSAYGESVIMESAYVTVHGQKVNIMDRTLSVGGKSVHHDYLELVKGQTGGGMAKGMFRDALPVYEKLGLKHIDTTANLDAGGFVWGRFGFKNTNPSDTAAFADRIGAKLSPLAGQLRSEYSRTKTLTPAQEEYQHLSKMLSESSRPGNTAWETMGRTYSRLNVPNLVAAHNKAFPGEKVKDSKALLAKWAYNGTWSARFDLTNKAEVDTLKQYIKGK